MPYFKNNHHQLFYREKGKGDLLLILPGNTASSVCHVNDLEYFGEKYHAVSMDFWGTGQSDRIQKWPVTWWEDCTNDLAQLVKHLNKEQCTIIGVSGGATIALNLAVIYPKLIKNLIIDSVADMYLESDLEYFVQERKQRTPEQISFWKGAQGEDWEDVIREDTEIVMNLKKRDQYYRDKLDRIQCPVLFIGSLKDEFISNIGESMLRMTSQVKNSQLVLFNKGSHPVIWSCANEFRQLVDLFLNSELRSHLLESSESGTNSGLKMASIDPLIQK